MGTLRLEVLEELDVVSPPAIRLLVEAFITVFVDVVVDNDEFNVEVDLFCAVLYNVLSSALLLDLLGCNFGVVATIEVDLGLRSCLCCLVLRAVLALINSAASLVRDLTVLVDVLPPLEGKGIRVGVFATVRADF